MTFGGTQLRKSCRKSILKDRNSNLRLSSIEIFSLKDIKKNIQIEANSVICFQQENEFDIKKKISSDSFEK